MKKQTVVFVLVACLAGSAGTAVAQFKAGGIQVGPHFGFSIDDNFGVTFGGGMTYAFTRQMAVGPIFSFSTAGRKFELKGQDGATLESGGANSLIFGGRWYYMFNPEHNYPWYVDAGFGLVKYGSIDEIDGKKFTLGGAEAKIEGATRFGFNFGSGTMFGINDKMSMVIDANSYVGGHGDPVIKSSAGEVKVEDGGSFWHLALTVGVNFDLSGDTPKRPRPRGRR
jgi:hypothetical protein